jgi:hypothetical protein
MRFFLTVIGQVILVVLICRYAILNDAKTIREFTLAMPAHTRKHLLCSQCIDAILKH